MNRQHSSLVRRALTQMDLAFWYLRAHPTELFVLGAPTLAALSLVAVAVVAVIQTWELPGIFSYVLFAIAVPTVVTWIVVLAPLPCAVFAWGRASGSPPAPGECFAFCRRRLRRLLGVSLRLFFSCLLWYMLFGLLILVYFPRSCVAPVVALFEENRRISERCRRLLKEDLAVRVLAGLYLGVLLALAFLLFLPRLWLILQDAIGQTPNSALETPVSRWIWDHLWIAETIGSGMLLSAMAVSWCISITLLYRDIRVEREGELLRGRVAQLRRDLFGERTTESAPQP